MEMSDGHADRADDTKLPAEAKTRVLSALFHLERAFMRMGEVELPKDLRSPEHEVCARLMAAIYEVQSIAYPEAVNHARIIEDAAMFDDLPAQGFVIAPSDGQ